MEYSIIVGILAGVVLMFMLQIVTGWFVIPFVGRFLQAGRKGYGFEHYGMKRLKTAFSLWCEYDALRPFE